MRDYEAEFRNRVEFIKSVIADSSARGIVYGNSGGKDSALVGILCKAACENTVGIIMPCSSRRNYLQDTEDALTVAEKYGIETRTVDLSPAKDAFTSSVDTATLITHAAAANIAPRLRMTVLYTVAAGEGRLVAGTGNRSEAYMGYFTKWGDGACDFNPIADLTVTEIYEFLRWLEAPECIIKKAPSAGLFDGQTDELEMGVSYSAIDRYLEGEAVSAEERDIIEAYHRKSEHKRNGIRTYRGEL